MDGLSTLFNAILFMSKLELCWIQFQLQGLTFFRLSFLNEFLLTTKLQDLPQTPLHLYFQYILFIIIPRGHSEVCSGVQIRSNWDDIQTISDNI